MTQIIDASSDVCLGTKLSPFSDISQNSVLEKRTLKFNVRKTTLHKKFSQNSLNKA